MWLAALPTPDAAARVVSPAPPCTPSHHTGSSRSHPHTGSRSTASGSVTARCGMSAPNAAGPAGRPRSAFMAACDGAGDESAADDVPGEAKNASYGFLLLIHSLPPRDGPLLPDTPT